MHFLIFDNLKCNKLNKKAYYKNALFEILHCFVVLLYVGYHIFHFDFFEMLWY